MLLRNFENNNAVFQNKLVMSCARYFISAGGRVDGSDHLGFVGWMPGGY